MSLIFGNNLNFQVWRKLSIIFLIVGGLPSLFLLFEGIARDLTQTYGPTIPTIAENIDVWRGIIFGLVLFGIICYAIVLYIRDVCDRRERRYRLYSCGLTHTELKDISTYGCAPVTLVLISLGLWSFGSGGETAWEIIGGEIMPAAILPLIFLCSMCCCAGSLFCLMSREDVGNCFPACACFLISIGSASFVSLLGTRLGSYNLAPGYNDFEVIGQTKLINNKTYSWLSIFFPTIVVELLLMPYFLAMAAKSWVNRESSPADTAKCTGYQISSVMWIGWTIMRIILIIDDYYPETWTITNNHTNADLSSFDQMKLWGLKNEIEDGMYVSCVKYNYEDFRLNPLGKINGDNSDINVMSNKDHPVATIVGSRTLKIDDDGEFSAVGICAANCVTFPYYSLSRGRRLFKNKYIRYFTCECLSYYQDIQKMYQYSASQCINLFRKYSQIDKTNDYVGKPSFSSSYSSSDSSSNFPYRAIYRNYDFSKCLSKDDWYPNAEKTETFSNITSIGKCHDLCLSYHSEKNEKKLDSYLKPFGVRGTDCICGIDPSVGLWRKLANHRTSASTAATSTTSGIGTIDPTDCLVGVKNFSSSSSSTSSSESSKLAFESPKTSMLLFSGRECESNCRSDNECGSNLKCSGKAIDGAVNVYNLRDNVGQCINFTDNTQLICDNVGQCKWVSKGDIGVILKVIFLENDRYSPPYKYVGCYKATLYKQFGKLKPYQNGGRITSIRQCTDFCSENGYRYAGIVANVGSSKSRGACSCDDEFALPRRDVVPFSPTSCTSSYPRYDDTLYVYNVRSRSNYIKIGLIQPQSPDTVGCNHYKDNHCVPNVVDNASVGVFIEYNYNGDALHWDYVPCPTRSNERDENAKVLQNCVKKSPINAPFDSRKRYCYCPYGVGQCSVNLPEATSTSSTETRVNSMRDQSYSNSKDNYKYLHGNKKTGSIAVFHLKTTNINWKWRNQKMIKKIEQNNNNRDGINNPVHTNFKTCQVCRDAAIDQRFEDPAPASSSSRRRRRRSTVTRRRRRTPSVTCSNGEQCTTTLQCSETSSVYSQLGQKSFLYPLHGCNYPIKRIGSCSSFCSKTSSAPLRKSDSNWYSYTNRLVLRQPYPNHKLADICLSCSTDGDCKNGLECRDKDNVVGCVLDENILQTNSKFCSAITSNFVLTHNQTNFGTPPFVSSIKMKYNTNAIVKGDHKILEIGDKQTTLKNVGISFVKDGFFHRKNVSYSQGIKGAICKSRRPVEIPSSLSCRCPYHYAPIKERREKCTEMNKCGRCISSCQSDSDCKSGLSCVSIGFADGNIDGSERNTMNWVGTVSCPLQGDLKYGESYCSGQDQSLLTSNGNLDCKCGFREFSERGENPKDVPTLEDAMYQCNNLANECTGIMEYEARSKYDEKSYFLCTSWQCPLLLNQTIYNSNTMDKSFPIIYYKTSSLDEKFPKCLEYTDNFQKLSATAVILPIILSYVAVGFCCLFVTVANPIVDKAGTSYEDYQARKEQRRKQDADERTGARKIAHRIANTLPVLVSNPYQSNETKNGISSEFDGAISPKSLIPKGLVIGTVPTSTVPATTMTNAVNMGCVTNVGMTDGGMTDGGMTDGGMTDGGMTDGGMTGGGMTGGGMLPFVPVPQKIVTPMEQFNEMLNDINQWTGDIIVICDIFNVIIELINENSTLRNNDNKLKLIKVCKVKRISYPEQWNTEVAALFGQCLNSFTFMGSIGISATVRVPTRMLSFEVPNFIKRGRNFSFGRSNSSNNDSASDSGFQLQTRSNSTKLK